MKKRIVILLSVICIFIHKVNGQDSGSYLNTNIIGPSPEAASLVKVAETPVSLFTGTPNIGFPIYNLKCGSLSTNLSLSYDAQGVRVESLPTSMGTGWTLNAGGVITRSVRGGFVDLVNSGKNYLPLPADEQGIFDNMLNLATTKDTEPDAFYYNFNGYSGGFYLKNGKVVLKNQADISFELQTEGLEIKEIICTTPDGTKYYFWKRKYLSGFYYHEWYLQKICSASSNDIIYFEYVKGGTCVIPPKNSEFHMIRSNGVTSKIYNPYVRNYETKYQGDLLRKIYTSSNDSIALLYEVCNNEEVENSISNQKKLTDINIYNSKNSVPVKKFLFENNCVKTAHPYSLTSIGYPPIGWRNEVNYRLYLDSFTEVAANGDKKSYTFEYYGRISKTQDPLPCRLSFAQDLGGYYNGKNNNTTLIPTFNYKDNYPSMPLEHSTLSIYFFPVEGSNILIAGADRSSDENYMKYGTLKNVIYPTGGRVEYSFSTHRNPYNEELLWGLKVDGISYIDKYGSLLKEKKYEYENPALGREVPKFLRYTSYSDEYKDIDIFPLRRFKFDDSDYRLTVELSPGSTYNLGLYEGPLVGYGRVREFESGNGYAEYDYSMNPYNEVLAYEVSSIFQPTLLDPEKQDYTIGPLWWVFGPIEDESWKNGLLLEKRVYDSSHKLMQRETNKYSNMILDKVSAIKIHTVGADSRYLYNEFDYKCYWNRLDSKTTVIDNIETVKTFTYNGNRRLASQKIDDSKGESVSTKYIYPQDFSSNDNILNTKKLQEAKISQAICVESQNEKTKKIISSVLYEYNVQPYVNVANLYVLSESNLTIPLTVNELSNATDFNSFSNRLKNDITLRYSDSGRTISIENISGISTTYLWGYNNQYPVAKIENATYSKVEAVVNVSNIQTLSNADNDHGIRGSATNEEKLRVALDALRNIAGAMVTTYTYDPLIGMTSQTDPNGITTYYEYDDFGRLQYVRDHDGNIVKLYQYNYKH
ncbi:hypothetical protein [Labilibaculum euxinus]